MPDLRWYVHRLAAMSPAELVYRLRQRLRSELERRDAGRWPSNAVLMREMLLPSVADPDSLLRTFREKAVHHWSGIGQPDYLSQVIHSQFPDNLAATLRQADALYAGQFTLFGREFKYDGLPSWHRDPLSDREWPGRFWGDIDIREGQARGGVKWVWELNRQQYLVTVSKAHFLTKLPHYAGSVVTHILDWIEQNPPSIGVSWTSPLELALRLISWFWSLYLIHGAEALTPERFWQVAVGMWTQASHIERHLSAYSSANNHLIGEAAALFVVGVAFPWFRKAKHWQAQGLHILAREIERQIHPDGVPAEQAIRYLAFDVEFYLLVVALAHLNQIEIPPVIPGRLSAACDFLAHTLDTSGWLPMWGDSDDGRAIRLDDRATFNPYRAILGVSAVVLNRPEFARVGDFGETGIWLLGLEGLAKYRQMISAQVDPSLGSRVFPKGGYAVLRNKDYVLTLDGGPLGYLGTATHGHADALSITLSLNGVPILVDAGTYCYHEDPAWRDYFRSTRAHNTLIVDGQSQSQAGGLFLWTAKARAWLADWDLCEEQSWVEAIHDGYQRLGVLHRRRVYAIKHSFWVIIDWLDGKGKHHIMQPWHTPAGAQVILNRKLNAVEIRVADVILSLVPWNGVAGTPHLYCGQSEPVIQGWVSTSYGHKEPAPAIVWERRLELPVQLVTVLWPASLADFDQELAHRLLSSLPVLPKSSRG